MRVFKINTNTLHQLLKYYPPPYVLEHLITGPHDKTRGNAIKLKEIGLAGAPDFNNTSHQLLKYRPLRTCRNI